MAFGADAIALVTGGLRFDSGTFEERLVSHGLVGDINPAVPFAIDKTGNPFKITGEATAATRVTDSPVMIQSILWTGADTDGHSVSVTDKAGNQLWKGQMVTSKLNEDIAGNLPLGLYSSDGIYINDMDSGELYIYIK